MQAGGGGARVCVCERVCAQACENLSTGGRSGETEEAGQGRDTKHCLIFDKQ